MGLGSSPPSYLHDKDAHPHRAKHVLVIIKPHLHFFIAALGSRDPRLRQWQDRTVTTPPAQPPPHFPSCSALALSFCPSLSLSPRPPALELTPPLPTQGSTYKATLHTLRPPSTPTF